MKRSKPTVLDTSLVDSARAAYAQNRRAYFRDCLRVRHRDSGEKGLAALVLNPCQEALLRLVENVERFNQEVRAQMKLMQPDSDFPNQVAIIVDKPRKQGVSTLVEAIGFHLCEFNSNTNALVMAHRKENAENIGQICRRFQQAFPKEYLPIKVPMERTGSGLLEWGEKQSDFFWDSRLIIQTGKNEAVARGYDWDFVHISEEAHFDNPDAVSAALNGVRRNFYSFEESTANGYDAAFYPAWQKAMYFEEVEQHWKEHGRLPDGWSGKYRFFWPWFRDPGYQLPASAEEEEYMRANMEPAEAELVDRYGCTMQQLKWRRHTIENKCSNQTKMSPEAFFCQEYPATPEESFVTSSQSIFDQGRLADLLKQAEDLTPAWHGYISSSDGRSCMLQASKFKNISGSPLIIWEKPKPGHQYVIGVDVASGKDEGGDYSVASVWDRTDGSRMAEVARYRGKANPYDMAAYAIHLGFMYNVAFMVPETNNDGTAMAMRIWQLGYPAVYHRKNEDMIGAKADTNAFQIGFKTHEHQKPALVHQAAYFLRQRLILIRSVDAIREWAMFSNIEGKLTHPAGEHDDCVMADALAVFGQAVAAPKILQERAEQKAVTRINSEADPVTQAVQRKKKLSEKKNRAEQRMLRSRQKIRPDWVETVLR